MLMFAVLRPMVIPSQRQLAEIMRIITGSSSYAAKPTKTRPTTCCRTFGVKDCAVHDIDILVAHHLKVRLEKRAISLDLVI